jgi:hypothetical protein
MTLKTKALLAFPIFFSVLSINWSANAQSIFDSPPVVRLSDADRESIRDLRREVEDVRATQDYNTTILMLEHQNRQVEINERERTQEYISPADITDDSAEE